MQSRQVYEGGGVLRTGGEAGNRGEFDGWWG